MILIFGGFLIKMYTLYIIYYSIIHYRKLHFIFRKPLKGLLEPNLSSFTQMYLESHTTFRSSRPRGFCKKDVLKNFATLQESTCARDFLLKKILAQVFSFEFCKFFKNTVFYRTRPVAASEP